MSRSFEDIPTSSHRAGSAVDTDRHTAFERACGGHAWGDRAAAIGVRVAGRGRRVARLQPRAGKAVRSSNMTLRVQPSLQSGHAPHHVGLDSAVDVCIV